MKKLMILVLLIFGFVGSAYATSFTFYGEDNGGVGSANMNISISGNTLTLTLDNTSPITLESPLTGYNAPAITGFGFNLSNGPLMSSWSLVAYDTQNQNNSVVIGSSSLSGLSWTLGTTQSAVTLDYLEYLQNVQGGLYNPLAYENLATKPNYFTTATLVINFDSAPILEMMPQDFGSGISGITYVRMQNVGEDGEGSLKLPNTVPEPFTLLLLGLGLVGLAGAGRKLKK